MPEPPLITRPEGVPVTLALVGPSCAPSHSPPVPVRPHEVALGVGFALPSLYRGSGVRTLSLKGVILDVQMQAGQPVQVRPQGADSTPSQGEPQRTVESASDAPRAAPRGRGIGRPFSSEEGRKAALQRVAGSRQTRTTEVEALEAAVDALLAVVKGPKSTPAAQRTAAAKALGEAYDALNRAREREQSTTAVPWEAMSEERHTLMDAVLRMSDESVERMLRLAEEEQGSRSAPAGLAVRERPPTPLEPESRSRESLEPPTELHDPGTQPYVQEARP